jgi:UDP-N-acetylglucosamine 4-epimerase
MYQESYHDIDISQYRFLVTGGAGFIGSNIVEYLLKYGAGKVRVLDDLSTGSMDNIKPFLSNPAFEFIKGDICDYETCRSAVRNIDFISHQAALGSVPRSINNPIRTNEVNVTGFLNMLTAAKEANIRKMVYAASSSTYGDHPALPKVEETIGNPLSPYAVTKYVNELYAAVFSRVYGFHTIGLRYFNVFGPRQNPKGAYAAVIPLFVMAALQNEAPTINGDGQTSRDFTFIQNVVQANMRALFSEQIEQHEVFNIAAGHQVTLNELWRAVQHVVGTDIAPRYQQERRGDVKHSLAAITKANKLLGYHPDTLFEEGLRMTIKWYRKQLVDKAPIKVTELHG